MYDHRMPSTRCETCIFTLSSDLLIRDWLKVPWQARIGVFVECECWTPRSLTRADSYQCCVSNDPLSPLLPRDIHESHGSVSPIAFVCSHGVRAFRLQHPLFSPDVINGQVKKTISTELIHRSHGTLQDPPRAQRLHASRTVLRGDFFHQLYTSTFNVAARHTKTAKAVSSTTAPITSATFPALPSPLSPHAPQSAVKLLS